MEYIYNVIFFSFYLGREQGDCPGHLKTQLLRSSHIRCLVQKVGGAHREDKCQQQKFAWAIDMADKDFVFFSFSFPMAVAILGEHFVTIK